MASGERDCMIASVGTEYLERAVSRGSLCVCCTNNFLHQDLLHLCEHGFGFREIPRLEPFGEQAVD
jgi:hypothetical protein